MSKKLRTYDPDLGRRTSGERLWLARRAAGITIVDAARMAGVGENAYAAAERDRNRAVRGPVAGIPAVSKPTLPQLLALARRRSGLDLDAAASVGGCSRVTLLLKERTGSRGLKMCWANWGFTFPRK